MEDKLDFRESEVYCLRRYYKKVSPAIKDLRLSLKSMSTIPNLTSKEKFAINILYEVCDEGE